MIKKIERFLSLNILIKTICVLLILYLLQKTRLIWIGWLDTTIAIFKPFMIGFGLAYILHPLVTYFESKKIPKNFSIIMIWIVILFGIVVVGVELIPTLSNKIQDFISSMIVGVEWIGEKIIAYGEFSDFSIVDEITGMITHMLGSYQKWLPEVINSIPNFMSTVLGILANGLFSIIVAIYVLFDYERLKEYTILFFENIFSDAYIYLHEINLDLSVYIRSVVLIMGIKFVEYSLFYYMIGHGDWLIIGLLSAIGVLVPYLGGTVANGIGIITGITLGFGKMTLMLIGICILSNLDAYVISPLLHEKRSSIGPLVTLLAVFAGGILAGALGVMLSIPIAIVIRSIYETYHTHVLKKETFSTDL